MCCQVDAEWKWRCRIQSIISAADGVTRKQLQKHNRVQTIETLQNVHARLQTLQEQLNAALEEVNQIQVPAALIKLLLTVCELTFSLLVAL